MLGDTTAADKDMFWGSSFASVVTAWGSLTAISGSERERMFYCTQLC